ncbi:arylsulfatase [Selenomonas sp. FOBRC9]|uniref:phosphoethanolamine transferase n=1 Tax=Selenomonas sp. FOBRC9 TaxID=936573 RepID=UPI00027A4B66|nr:phosphoethanolamine transferase [Selenomonas sp. FOBRC9]EJP30695.1 arylsulfatase [Selenomonas sp. FOBRC9]
MKLTVERQNELIRWTAAAGAYFLALTAADINMGQDMGAEYFVPALIPILGMLVLMQYGTGVSIFSRGMCAPLITGVLWSVTFPLLYAWTYAQDWYRSLIYYDFLIGTGQMMMLAALGGVLFHLGRKKLTAALLAILSFLMALIPMTQIAYYMTVWHALSPASLMALYLTNWHEAGDYIESTVGTVPAVFITIGLLALIYLSYRSFLALGRSIYPAAEGTRMGALLLVMIIAAAVHITLIPECSIAGVYKDVTDYVEQTQTYGLHRDERYDSLIIDRENTLAARAPGTVIFIIGESASRDYMHIYTPGFPYDDTPWMEEMTQNPGFILYQNTYSSWTQTVPVLERALTEKSQYNDKEFFESASLLDVAKKIGYKTYWFSNQGRYGQFDSAITMVAKTADEAEWTDDSYTFTSKYDEELLPYLTRIDPHANNFIVLHLMGSHIYYNNRYPGEWAKFESAAGDSTMTSAPSYANSVLYTDHILKEIFDYAQKNLNLRAMVYFSDHGENLKISHNPDVFKFDMVKIPFFIYLSPEYRAAFPRRSEILASRREAYFTNDMMYDTVCGLLGAPSNRYDPLQDFSSPSYGFTRETLTTMFGMHRLTEDTEPPIYAVPGAVPQEK